MSAKKNFPFPLIHIVNVKDVWFCWAFSIIPGSNTDVNLALAKKAGEGETRGSEVELFYNSFFVFFSWKAVSDCGFVNRSLWPKEYLYSPDWS